MILSITIALIVFLISLWRREFGLGAVILLWPAYLIRATIFGIPTTALELSIYALVVAWIIRNIIDKKFIWPKLTRWMTILTILWTLAWIMATAFSSNHQAGLGALKAWLIDPLLFGAIMLSVIRNEAQQKILFSAISLSGAIVAAWGIYEYITRHASLQDGRLSSFFIPVANYAAMYLAPILVLTIGWLLWKKLSRAWWVAAGIMAIALALTFSFGGYLSLGVGIIFFWWRWPVKKTKLIALGILIGVALIGLLALSRTPYLSEKFNNTDRSSSLVRTQIWRTSWQIIIEHPVVGIGPNNFEPIYRATIPKLYWPPLEWLVSQPHQLYLALWLETGLLGLLVFIGFIITWAKLVWTRVREGDGLAITALAAMLAILAHGFVDTPLFKNDLMLLFVAITLLPFLTLDKK